MAVERRYCTQSEHPPDETALRGGQGIGSASSGRGGKVNSVNCKVSCHAAQPVASTDLEPISTVRNFSAECNDMYL